MTSAWDKNFYKASKLFSPIVPAFKQLNYDKAFWPSLDDLNQLVNIKPVYNANKLPIEFVHQRETVESFDVNYEPLIYLEGKVQTRLESWHDFFQVLVWSTFPKLKSAINALHYEAALSRYKENPKNKQRTKIENFLTLFDECGSIIVYSEESFKSIIQDFRWKELFITHRDDFSNQIECVVFGHAMYEKAIKPYIGMTSHCLFLKQPNEYFSQSIEERNGIIDEALSQTLLSTKNWTTKSLNPFPILGVPDWHQGNDVETFYDDDNYFRQKRHKN